MAGRVGDVGRRPALKVAALQELIALVAAGSLLLWSVSTLYPVFADRFKQGAGGFSMMMSANGIGAAAGGILMTTIGPRLPRRLLIYGSAMLFCLCLLLLSVAPTYPLMLVILVVTGVAMVLLGINANTKVQTDVPDNLRGRVMAVYSLVFGGLMPLGGLEIGFLAQHLGAPRAVQINATLALLITIGVYLWSRAERRARELHPRHDRVSCERGEVKTEQPPRAPRAMATPRDRGAVASLTDRRSTPARGWSR